MSLIHDALKSMDSPRESTPTVAPVLASAQSRRPAWLDALLAFVIVLGAGILGWFIWQHQTRPAPDSHPVALAPRNANIEPLVSPAPVVQAALAPSTATVQADTSLQAQVSPLTPPLGVANTGSVQAPAPLAPARQMPTVISPAPTQERLAPAREVQRTAVARPGRNSRPTSPVVSEPVSKPVVDETPIELRFAHFVAAMKEGRTNDAESELVALKARLPAGSLGLLRAQAWFDLKAGRQAASADGYRAILDRMPGDEEAAINLASIQAGQQKTEEARATLDAAARLQPDSTALRAALAQFTPAARQ